MPISEKDKTSQEIIRAVIEITTDESKGRLTTYGVIAYMEDAIKYLKNKAFRSSPENYLSNEES